MRAIKIDKTIWASGIERLKSTFVLIGPVKEKAFHTFNILNAGELPDLSYRNSRLSPKSIIYPQSEIMFGYTLNEADEDCHILKEIPRKVPARAVIGIRPCDADAFLLVKKNFDSADYRDPYWMAAYEATTLVGLACNAPCATCFCTTAGSGPFNEKGLDVLLVDETTHFLARAITSRGEDFLQAAGWNETGDGERIEKMKAAAEANISSSVAAGNLASKRTTDLFNADFWQDVGFACINCGTCTYACPTCWCFDIQDEVQGSSGIRLRNWDSCMFPLFTFHGSGHNPRANKTQRVRQRFMHKLKYYVDKYGDGIQCVGCGRCVRLCPVNIDIRKVCDLMNRYEPSHGDR